MKRKCKIQWESLRLLKCGNLFRQVLLLSVPAGLAFVASSCGTTFMVAADDVYGTVPTRQEEYEQKLQRWEAENGYDATYADDYYADEYVQDEYAADTFNYDDYYDYEYSSRLKRFHGEEYLSDDYYSDYYTNYYWYDPDPYYYGTSIYLGYNWWYPSYSYYYRPGWYLGFGFGGWSFGLGWGGYYGWGGWGWPSYSWGYHDGFWDGYWAGHWHEHCYDYCYNPYDHNTYTQSYYGRRMGGSSMTRPVVRTSSGGSASPGSSGSVSSAPLRRATFCLCRTGSYTSFREPDCPVFATLGHDGCGFRPSFSQDRERDFAGRDFFRFCPPGFRDGGPGIFLFGIPAGFWFGRGKTFYAFPSFQPVHADAAAGAIHPVFQAGAIFAATDFGTVPVHPYAFHIPKPPSVQ